MLGSQSRYADLCRKENFIGAGFLPDQDLTGKLSENWRTFNEKFIPVWMKQNPEKSKTSAGLSCGFLWTICKGLQIDDIVLCPDGKGYYYIGTIAGDYYYSPETELPHRRQVQWMDKMIARADMSDMLKNSTGSIGTCCDITKYSEEIEELIANATNHKGPKIIDDGVTDLEQDQDPEELIKKTHIQLENKLIEDLLEYVISLSPEQFEKLVLQLLVKMGYGEARHTGHSGDEGIDGIIDEDKLGIDVIHIQAKRYKIGNNIGRDTLQAFVGALAGQNSRKGIFITTSDYTKQAKEYVPNGVRIVKINGMRLAKLMIEYNMCVRTKEVYEVKALDKTFLEI